MTKPVRYQKGERKGKTAIVTSRASHARVRSFAPNCSVPSLEQRLERRVGLMSSAEVCQYLACHENTLYERVRKGLIRAVKDGIKLKFDPAEVLRYIQQRKM